MTTQFDHTAVGGVTTCFYHATCCDVIEEVRIRNKVRESLSLIYIFLKILNNKKNSKGIDHETTTFSRENFLM